MNSILYSYVATRDNRGILFGWCKDIFDLDIVMKSLESHNYTTKVWRCGKIRERLW